MEKLILQQASIHDLNLYQALSHPNIITLYQGLKIEIDLTQVILDFLFKYINIFLGQQTTREATKQNVLWRLIEPGEIYATMLKK